MSKICVIILLGIIVIVGLIISIICKCKRKMKIIMLAGASGTGKTATLKLVYKQLSNNKKLKYKRVKGTKSKDKEYYPLYHNKKKVALCTAGDQWCYIKKSIIKYFIKGADVLIIAFNKENIEKENAEKLFQSNF